MCEPKTFDTEQSDGVYNKLDCYISISVHDAYITMSVSPVSETMSTELTPEQTPHTCMMTNQLA